MIDRLRTIRYTLLDSQDREQVVIHLEPFEYVIVADQDTRRCRINIRALSSYDPFIGRPLFKSVGVLLHRRIGVCDHL